MKRMTSLVAIVAMVAACQKTETMEQANARMQAESDSARAQIEQAAAAFGRAILAGNVDSMIVMYAENATVMPPNMPAMTGTEAIRQGFTDMMSQGAPSSFQVQPASVVANGPLAVARGRWRMTMGQGASAMADSGKYLEHWHRINGQWKLVDDIWNSDAAPPPPARRR